MSCFYEPNSLTRDLNRQFAGQGNEEHIRDGLHLLYLSEECRYTGWLPKETEVTLVLRSSVASVECRLVKVKADEEYMASCDNLDEKESDDREESSENQGRLQERGQSGGGHNDSHEASAVSTRRGSKASDTGTSRRGSKASDMGSIRRGSKTSETSQESLVSDGSTKKPFPTPEKEKYVLSQPLTLAVRTGSSIQVTLPPPADLSLLWIASPKAYLIQLWLFSFLFCS